MSQKLFGGSIEPACRYCSVGTPNIDKEYVLCPKKGVMEACSSCRAFRYDPLRREIRRPKTLDTAGLTPEQFKL